MAVNWGLAGDTFDPLQVLQAYGKAQSQKIEGLRMERQSRREESDYQRREAARPVVQQKVATGDYAGAQAEAANAGDYDYAKAIMDLGKGSREQTAATADVIGSVAIRLKSVSPEQRGQALASMGPALAARGVTPDQIASIDTSDQSLDGWAAGAVSAKEQLAAVTKANEQYTLAPGSARYDASGKLIVEQPFAPRPISVSPGETVVEYQPGGGGGVAPVMSGDQVEQIALAAVPGAQVTSRTRTPEHNREVGGAPNSYHLTGQARDLVPPRGMTMAQFDRTIRPTMEAQGLRVINEGDHLHVQPARRNGGGGPRVIAQGAPKVDRAEQNAFARDRKDTAKSEIGLRKEFDALPEVKEFKQVRTAFQQIRNIAVKPNPTAQDDIALIFSYMKMLDPGSVVREGEFANAQNAAGIPETVQNLYNRAVSGNRLNPGQRRNMAGTAATIYKQQRGTYNEAATRYRGYARDLGSNPDRIATPANTNDGGRRSPPAGRTVPRGWKVEVE